MNKLTILLGVCLTSIAGVLLAYKAYVWWVFDNWLELPASALYEQVVGSQPQLIPGGLEGYLQFLLALDLAILLCVPGVLLLALARMGKWKTYQGTQLSRIQRGSRQPPIAD